MESRACGRLINTWSTAAALLQISVSNFYVELMKTMGTCVINAETYHRVHSIYYVLTDPNLIQYVNGGLYVHFELSEIKPFLCLCNIRRNTLFFSLTRIKISRSLTFQNLQCYFSATLIVRLTQFRFCIRSVCCKL